MDFKPMKTPEPQGYLNDEGRAIYFEICKLLGDYEALEEIDSYGLSQAAMWLWLFHEASEIVNKRGPVQVYKTDAEGISAYLTVMKTASAMFKDLSAKYGLSNKDRELMLKFKAKKDEGDALDDLK